ncbi:divergent polysaccharide deacetylase family protein [Sulfitobacter sp.]|uniref:divergent polysaccharide deacetylase family protein n=1 Tax=Sulfitobacter sp. TaxID=1903071 RepID=UPI003003845D
MAQGILSGIGLGAVFSLGVAGVVSVLVPIEPRPAPELGTAETVAVPEAPVEQPRVTITYETGSAPVQPQASLRAPASEELPNEPVAAALPPQMATDLGEGITEAPLDGAPVTAPTTETAALALQPRPLPTLENGQTDATPQVPAALPQPQTGGAASLTKPRPLPTIVSVQPDAESPVLPNPQALAPMIPDDSVDADVTTQAEANEAVEPQADPAEEVVVVVVPPQTQEPSETQTAEQASEAETPTAPKPRVLPARGDQAVTLGTPVLPRIGTPANSLITRDEQGGSVETLTQTASNDPVDAAPIRRYAQPFENPEGKPLMGIVLMDTGADLDAAEIGLPALSSFPYPVSFAVDVTLVDAAKRVERYRAEGFDVLAMVNLPQGARPSDAEVSISVALNGMPEIVGVLEGTGEGLQSSREVADQVTRILLASGHGLVTQNRGLNSMPKLAVKEGVPAAPVFRDFDAEGQQPRVIRRFLDQAAFKAGQEGGVIMLGRLRPETIEALLVWGLAERASSVALAPVSAVLLAQ